MKNTEDNKMYASKTMLAENEADFKQTLREIRFLRSNRHPFIIDVYDGFIIQQTKIFHIVMPFCETGDLSKMITNAKKTNHAISEHNIIKWAIQLALAIHFLHENGTLHRDLKPNNVMLLEGGDLVKLVDFGLAVQLENGVCEQATEVN